MYMQLNIHVYNNHTAIVRLRRNIAIVIIIVMIVRLIIKTMIICSNNNNNSSNSNNSNNNNIYIYAYGQFLADVHHQKDSQLPHMF